MWVVCVIIFITPIHKVSKSCSSAVNSSRALPLLSLFLLVLVIIANMFCGLCFPKKRSVDTLDYSHQNLLEVPAEVYQSKRTLQRLYLNTNHIRDLPKVSMYCTYARTMEARKWTIVPWVSARLLSSSRYCLLVGVEAYHKRLYIYPVNWTWKCKQRCWDYYDDF